jgi:uncharacterized protein (TIGR02145 family)
MVTGLTNGTAYSFTVTATNANGIGPASSASNAVTPSTVPSAPTIGTATKGNAQATITFSAPSSDGGATITGYTATSNPGSITGTGTGSPITVTGLTNGTAYTFTVTATNFNGNGSASLPSNSVTPSTIPGAPTIGTATAGNAQATVTFTAPVSNGGSAITLYTATSTPGGLTGTSTGGPITVTGLTNGTAYTFTVTATNANGPGPASSASNSVTPTICVTSTLTITHTAGSVAPVTKTVTYGLVQTNLSGSNKCWITQNLGASTQASAATDASETSAGWYWQFNREMGYKHDGTNSIPASWAVSVELGDWLPARDPCTTLLGTGWRIPTITEWTNVDNNGGWGNYNNSYASILKLHAAGYLYSSDGGFTIQLYSRGVAGYYWSSNQYSDTNGYGLYIQSSFSIIGYGNSKAIGHSLRCIKD